MHFTGYSCLNRDQAGYGINELIEWDGEGLFLDPVLTWFDAENMPNNNMTVNIGGAIRDLTILEVEFTSLWKSDSMNVTIALILHHFYDG